MHETCSWTHQSPFGPLAITVSANGVRHVALGRTNGSSARCSECGIIDDAFGRYFGGDATALDQIQIDLSDASTDFERRVLATLREAVPAGQTTSYGALAAAAGKDGAARAVGGVMALNPVPILIPCHRVLASDGTLGGYGGGLDMKRGLLAIEGVTVKKRAAR